MRTPGRAVAEWIVADPRRFTLTPKTDTAFYTFMVNAALLLTTVGAIVFLLAVTT